MKVLRKFSFQRLNHIRKFYKEVLVEQRDLGKSEFFITLDHKKLKTPDGH